jgi:hypothetical protein
MTATLPNRVSRHARCRPSDAAEIAADAAEIAADDGD